MKLDKIYANVSCSDLASSLPWFAALFGREPDAEPMTGLAEWHHRPDAGLQLFENKENAGRGTVTLIVSSLDIEHARLAEAGLDPATIETADYVRISRLRDPDGNLVVLAQPR